MAGLAGGGSSVGKYPKCRAYRTAIADVISQRKIIARSMLANRLDFSARFDHRELRMSALTQAGLPGERLKRHKSEFKLAAFAATLCFTIGIAIPIYAQQAPKIVQKSPVPPAPQPPRNVQEQAQSHELALAQDAIEKQKELIAALERRVKELEEELADCKAQRQDVVPPKQ